MEWNGQLIIALLGAMGVSGVLSTLLVYILKRRDTRLEKRQATTVEEIRDNTAMRGELWSQLQVALERNTALSERYGVILQEKAVAVGEKDAAQKQLTDLLARYATVAQKAEDADFRREKDREKFERRLQVAEEETDRIETERDHLARRVIELEQDIARLTRGAATRRSDGTPTGKRIVEIPTLPDVPSTEEPPSHAETNDSR